MAGGNKGGSVEAKLKGDVLSFLVYAAETIYRGSMVSVNAAGFAVQGDDTASETFVGIAEESIAGADVVASGDKRIRVRRRGIFKMTLDATSKAAAPTLQGDLVYIDTAQSSSVDELVGLAAQCVNTVLVGQIVRHGTEAEQIAGTSSAEVWVDILGGQNTLAGSTFTTTAVLAAYTAGSGAQKIGVEDASGYGTSQTVQDALESLVANGQIALGLTDFTAEDGTILTITADATLGYKQVANEEVVLQMAAAEVIQASIGLPDNIDLTADVTFDLVVVKNGTDADNATINLEAFATAVGAALASSGDAYAGAAKAITDNTNVQVLSFTLLAATLPDTARSLTLICTAAGTDEIYILGGTLKYTTTFA